MHLNSSYLRSTAAEAFYVRTSLSKIISIVKNLFIATTWLMLHVVQGPNFALSLHINFLYLNLKIVTENPPFIIYRVKL